MALINNQLAPCPGTPNCVSSEPGEAPRFTVDPLPYTGDADLAWQHLVDTVTAMNGQIQANEPPYLWATFTSRVFRFVDDMEFRLDPERQLIQLRSASRVGYCDFGVNQKRATQLRQQFIQRSE